MSIDRASGRPLEITVVRSRLSAVCQPRFASLRLSPATRFARSKLGSEACPMPRTAATHRPDPITALRIRLGAVESLRAALRQAVATIDDVARDRAAVVVPEMPSRTGHQRNGASRQDSTLRDSVGHQAGKNHTQRPREGDSTPLLCLRSGAACRIRFPCSISLAPPWTWCFVDAFLSPRTVNFGRQSEGLPCRQESVRRVYSRSSP